MSNDTAYRLGKLGLEFVVILDGEIDPNGWSVVDFDQLDEKVATDLRGIEDAIKYAVKDYR